MRRGQDICDSDVIFKEFCISNMSARTSARTSFLRITMLGATGVYIDRYHPLTPALRLAPAPNAKELNNEYWAQQAEQAINTRLKTSATSDNARNVVLFVGDGMSVPTLTASRIYLGQQKGATGEEAELFFESFPTTGLVKTYCADSQVGDSACTATAYLCGVKTNLGCIGVNAAVRRGDCRTNMMATHRAESIAEWALASGRDVGIVTTTRVTHATPAGMYAKVPDRGWEYDAAVKKTYRNASTCPDIAYQLVYMNPGVKFKVILGGGRRNFLPSTFKDEEGTKGVREDNKNLIDDWQQSKAQLNATYKYIWNRDQLMKTNNELPEYLLGLFDSSHMQFHLDANKVTEPTLSELTETAINMLRRNSRGFFLLVEGGRIDHAHHFNRVHYALDETVEMSTAVARACALLPENDSLIVVTADHAHVMAVNGYSNRGHSILGRSAHLDFMKVPYMTLSYTNGPGYYKQSNGTRTDVTKDQNFGTMKFKTHVDVPIVSATHGGDDVAVFARGPHHSMFSGLYEQSELPYRIAWVACIGPGHTRCTAAPVSDLRNAGAVLRPIRYHCTALFSGISVMYYIFGRLDLRS